jgi:hypothetical protein
MLTCFPDGLTKGQVVEVEKPPDALSTDRWYAKIIDGRWQGDPQDPFLLGQWLKANSTTELESTKRVSIHIKSIIAIVDH